MGMNITPADKSDCENICKDLCIALYIAKPRQNRYGITYEKIM